MTQTQPTKPQTLNQQSTAPKGTPSKSGSEVRSQGASASKETGEIGRGREAEGERGEGVEAANRDPGSEGLRSSGQGGEDSAAKQPDLLATLKQKAHDVTSQVKQYDEAHGISAKVAGKLKTLEEEHHISEKVSAAKVKASEAASVAKVKAGEAASKVMQNESFQKGFSFMQSGFAVLKKMALQVEESNRQFSEKLLHEAKNEQLRSAQGAEASQSGPASAPNPQGDGPSAAEGQPPVSLPEKSEQPDKDGSTAVAVASGA